MLPLVYKIVMVDRGLFVGVAHRSKHALTAVHPARVGALGIIEVENLDDLFQRTLGKNPCHGVVNRIAVDSRQPDIVIGDESGTIVVDVNA